jgi:probable F420-dependent oxidoreductase
VTNAENIDMATSSAVSTQARPMKVGFGALGNTPDEIVELARLAESIGFARIWFGDHLCQPNKQESKYPYGSVPMTLKTVDYLDPLVQAAAVASATSTIEIATSVYLLPMHHPLHVARAVHTLQTVAAGRFIFGVGIGWMLEEFAAVGVPFKRRGKRMDEALEVLRAAQAGGMISHNGTEFSFEPLMISHRAVAVPLIIGGSADVAFHRAARFGDGWVSTPELERDDLLRVRDRIEVLRREYNTTERPFTYYIRLPRADPSLAANLAADGFDEFNIGTVELFPRDQVASMSKDAKCAALARMADEFGLTASS